MRLKGKVAIVTGGSMGIGGAIVLRLASEGATVAFCDVDEKSAKKVVDEVASTGGEAFFVQADITNHDQIAKFVETVENRFGRVDLLVNNVGIGAYCPYVEMDPAMTDKILRTTLLGPMNITTVVLRGMLKRQSGKIVSISSDSARVGEPGAAVYSACKGGIISFTKSLARELATSNITVNSISPGATATEALRVAFEANPEQAKVVYASIPMGRAAEPAEIAAAVAFLASDDASYVTGQILSVNGGYCMV